MQEEPKGASQPEVQSGKGAGGNGNGSGNGYDHDRRLLDKLQLTAFSANPPSVPECSNATSTLSWNVVVTPETIDDVQFRLLEYFSPSSGAPNYWMGGGDPPGNPPNGEVDIGATGSFSQTIISPWRFDLVASLPDASKVLGTVIIGTGGNPNCYDHTLTCAQLDSTLVDLMLQKLVNIAQSKGLNERIVNGAEICGNKQDGVSHTFKVDSSGLHIVQFLTIPASSTPPWFIDVNVDITIDVAPFEQNCEMHLAVVQVSADADYPPAVDVLYPGLTTTVEAVLFSGQEGDIRQAIIQALGADIPVPGCDNPVHHTINGDGSITWTCCPPPS